MSFIFFFLFIIFLIFAIVLSLGASFLRLLFGRKFKGAGQHNRQANHSEGSSSDANNKESKKVFKKDEGEYVDYEEIE